jgi:aspartokinase-like uncharacterized kinase
VNDARPLVLKIGGGLLRDEGIEGLRRACAEVGALAAGRRVLVVPGGGPFADAVRAIDARVGLTDEVAHVLALQAMDQFGTLLRSLLRDAEPRAGLVAPRGLAVLGVEAAFAGRPGIPASWSVTSDSLAVLAAAAIGAEEAVLLKPVAGVFARWPAEDGDTPLPALTADELAELQAGGGGRVVDPYVPDAVHRTGVRVVVRAPDGVGTCVTPS